MKTKDKREERREKREERRTRRDARIEHLPPAHPLRAPPGPRGVDVRELLGGDEGRAGAQDREARGERADLFGGRAGGEHSSGNQ